MERRFYLFHLVYCLVLAKPHSGALSGISSMDLVIPGYKPKEVDDYICTAVEARSPGYIVEFIPAAIAENGVHHMLVYGCDEPTFQLGRVWDCKREAICKSSSNIYYAWARNAPNLVLPDGVGVPVGQTYLVLQVHYGEPLQNGAYDYSGVKLFVTPQKPPYLAGMYLMSSSTGTIPPQISAHPINISCRYDGDAEIRPFAFRTHTHDLGRSVSAYSYNSGEKTWTMIGWMNPQWPQAFYLVEKQVNVRPGDIIAAQCVYDSSEREQPTVIGSSGHDEMCNVYIYYYTNSSRADPALNSVCDSNERSDIFVTYPVNPAESEDTSDLQTGNAYSGLFRVKRVRRQAASNVRSEYGMGMGNADGTGMGAPYGVPVAVMDSDYVSGGNRGMTYAGGPALPSHVRKKPGPGLLMGDRVVWRPDSPDNAPGALNGARYYYNTDFQLGAGQPDVQPATNPGLVAVEKSGWLSPSIMFGQIAGLTFDNKGNLVVFHRVDRVWNDNSFDETNRFRERTSGPIMADTVISLSVTGNVVFRWGRGVFYMPEGIFIDKSGFLWATDVAMHQVFKFDTKGSSANPVLSLGVEFEPGADERHFCKPTSVAVADDGTIFVADGYCNSRIMKFKQDGAFVSMFGGMASGLLANGYPKLGLLSLPHSLSLHDAARHILVADQENARVQIFNYNGTALDQITDARFGSKVGAVSYCVPLDTIFLLTGPTSTQTVDGRVFAVDGKSRRLTYSWRPQSAAFQRPHALAVSSDCSRVFVGEIGPKKLWRFDLNFTAPREAFITVGKGDGAKKPESVDDGSAGATVTQNMTQMLSILTVAIAVPVLIIAAICLCIRFRKRGGFRAMNMTATYSRSKGKDRAGRLPLLGGAFRDRNGFQRLSTEDVDAMDEMTDESDTEDTLYPVTQKNSTAPQKA